eukprot:CAMPEP_0176316432 /NCGR_PEP_ID=MMETSP0121_2-20121125/68726_1 /TAXON_ID=160619 /ORGANISM="Kryptoperidinium foliaceum, Strain CCMP 1326" /LENGTH=77 /DNA_ID=CAMNT_0017658635 /DNA_START=126 /DNA_END=356 /DNA_ORIENTATION=+
MNTLIQAVRKIVAEAPRWAAERASPQQGSPYTGDHRSHSASSRRSVATLLSSSASLCFCCSANAASLAPMPLPAGAA